MAIKTSRLPRPVASETKGPARKTLAGARKNADGERAKKNTGTKAEAAKAKQGLTTAQKLKAALDASAEKEATEKARRTATSPKQAEMATAAGMTKSATVMSMLRTSEGATLEAMQQATGWQAHSVRGFLSGTVRKKQGMSLISERGQDGVRRYWIDDAAVAA